MRFKNGLLALAMGLAPLSIAAAQVTTRQDPRDRRPTTGGTIGDIIVGDRRVEAPRQCRVRDAVTPDGRVVQICDDRGRGRRGRHVNDRDGDGDFDARDRAIRKRQHEIAKLEKKRSKELRKAQRGDDDDDDD
jgi:hypothetical protein